jgi:general secretion pathway protein G
MAVLFPNFMGIRQRARDAQRKSDLSQLQKALELYKLDQDPPAYPTSMDTCGTCWSSNGIGDPCPTGNVYMKKLPCDPQNPTPYIYKSGTDVLQYSLYACLENLQDTDKMVTPEPTCYNTTGASYYLTEP